MEDKRFWVQDLSYKCPVCGFRVLDGDLSVTSHHDGTDYALCPDCGNESILLQEYW